MCLTLPQRFADAIEAAMLAASAEPLRESAHKTLIRAHIAEGNLTEARRVYLAYRGLLARELGVRPSADFTAGLGIPLDRASANVAVSGLPRARQEAQVG